MNIIGRLTRDVEIRILSNEKQLVDFSIATDKNYRNKQGERTEQTTYSDSYYWICQSSTRRLRAGTYISAWLGKDGDLHVVFNLYIPKNQFHSNDTIIERPTEFRKG